MAHGLARGMFIEDVQRWLTEPPEAETVPELPEGFDLDGRREVVWRALEEMEPEPNSFENAALAGLREELGRPEPDHVRRDQLWARIQATMSRMNEFASDAVRLSAAIAPEELVLVDVVQECGSRHRARTEWSNRRHRGHFRGGRTDRSPP